MAMINGGHLVGKYLKEVEKVEMVFGISGGHLESILDSFTEYKIRTIDVRHEQAAAMMAHAWSVYTGKPGVCFLTAGPGFTNGLTGIANAYLDNAPLIVLCGRSPLRDDLKGALQEMNQIEAVRPMTKWAATCYDIKRIPEYLAMAFRNATGGRPGPVMLELPPDILNIKVDESLVPMPSKSNPKYSVHPDDAELRAAAEIINNAKKPLFLGGSGVGFSNCADSLKQFVEKTPQYDAVIVLGCVIQGDTPHFDFVCQGVTYGISELNARRDRCPVIFGVLTTNTLQQALDRAGGKLGNKGVEAAITAIKMANIVW